MVHAIYLSIIAALAVYMVLLKLAHARLRAPLRRHADALQRIAGEIYEITK